MLFCDGPRGLVSDSGTCFPVAMGRGASFDLELQERIGEAIAKEIRAVGGNYFGGVCVNLLRHPAGGRAQETYGEDPFHIGAMGAAITRGVQAHNVMACVKHFALNNQENTRFKIDVDCDERTLREVYLPHFKDIIEAGAASVMGAYNKFRGVQCCHSAYLLRKILKQEWEFDGFVISDFNNGVKDTVEAAEGGCDIEMASTRYYGKRLVKAVRAGQVSEANIDEAVRRIVRTILMFAEADDPLPDYPHSLVASQEHIALALEAAEKSIVLLKNDLDTLPWDPTAIKKLALIGKLGKMENIGDHGSSRVHPPYVVTPIEGLKKLLGHSVEILYSNGARLTEAVEYAKMADAVVFVGGYGHKDEGEYTAIIGGDRDSLELHRDEIELIRAVAPANKNCAVVLIGGSAILMESWKTKVPAILHAFYPGMEGGTAIARVLFGVSTPGGKLPFTIPTDENHLPDFNKKALSVRYDGYHGYTRLEKNGIEPAYAFGFGLSYTSFEQDKASFQVVGDQVVGSMVVTNGGDRAGDQVVQFYVGFENSAVERPKKLLRGFRRVQLESGESKAVEISCPIDKLRWYNPATASWELERMVYQAYIGCSSRPADLLDGFFALT
jgi:beta-glucosidase